MTKIATPNYSPAQEASIRGFTPTGPEGRYTLADATAIAALIDKTPKSVVAKIGKMELPYAKKQPARKDGSAVALKAALVAQITAETGLTFTALSNAGREDLVKLRDYLAA